MQTFISGSVQDTEQIAKDFAKKLCPGDVVAYFGDLGAGKTAFTRGIVSVLVPTAEVTSPTFTFFNQYLGGNTVNHFDMYRVGSFDDLYNIGFFDAIDGKGITLIEWSENIPFALPKGAYTVQIARGKGDNDRVITIGKWDEEG